MALSHSFWDSTVYTDRKLRHQPVQKRHGDGKIASAGSQGNIRLVAAVKIAAAAFLQRKVPGCRNGTLGQRVIKSGVARLHRVQAEGRCLLQKNAQVRLFQIQKGVGKNGHGTDGFDESDGFKGVRPGRRRVQSVFRGEDRQAPFPDGGQIALADQLTAKWARLGRPAVLAFTAS